MELFQTIFIILCDYYNVFFLKEKEITPSLGAIIPHWKAIMYTDVTFNQN